MISRIPLTGAKQKKQEAREEIAIASGYLIRERLARNQELQEWITHANPSLHALDRKVKHGEDLSFEEAFCGMNFVLAATNFQFFQNFRAFLESRYGADSVQVDQRVLAGGTAFLQLMAAKEAFRGLTPEEVAGMTTAALMDTVLTLKAPHVVETSGMGGDRGFELNGTPCRTINASTLSALVLAALGLPSFKHGSYGNTSAVGSTEAIESFGALTSYRSEEEVWNIHRRSGFCFLDAHWCKTIHDLSHLLRMETINHVVGPMSAPFHPDTKIHKAMGVNEKVHPEVIAQAFALLHQRKKQSCGGVMVFCGLDEAGNDIDPNDKAAVRRHTIVDEISPYRSVVAAAYEDRFLGTFVISPEDFGVRIDPETIQIPNRSDYLQKGNKMALSGADPDLTAYLAMNAAMGLFAAEYLGRADAVSPDGFHCGYLRECFERCRSAITSGEAHAVLRRYVKATGGTVKFLL